MPSWRTNITTLTIRLTHELTTGPEIMGPDRWACDRCHHWHGDGWERFPALATISNQRIPNIKIVGVDIEGSILTEIWQSGGKIPEGAYPKTYKVEGIGEDFLPSATDLSVVDWIERAGDRESFLWARQLVRQEGIFAGGSSGSALAGASNTAANYPVTGLPCRDLPRLGFALSFKILR